MLLSFTALCRNQEPVGGLHRAATVTALDAAVGRVVKAWKAADLFDNSFILFSSDNGGANRRWGGGAARYLTACCRFNTPLRGKKEQLYEGGVRVPGFLLSPLLPRPGTTNTGLTHATDWFATVLHLAGESHSHKTEVCKTLLGIVGENKITATR